MALPHLRDQWAGYRFLPGRLAIAGETAWMLDRYLPVFVSIDLATERPGSPVSARAALGNTFGAFGLATGQSRFYVLGNPGLWALDQATGEPCWHIANAWSSLLQFRDRLWAPCHYEIAEITADGDVRNRFSMPDWKSLRCAVSDDWVVVAAWPERGITPMRLARFEPDGAGPVWTTERPARTDAGVIADGDVLWISDVTQGEDGAPTTVLAGIDPASGAQVAEVVPTRPSRCLVRDGIAWCYASVARQTERGSERHTRIEAIELSTGRQLADHDLGSVGMQDPVASSDSVWIPAYGADEPRLLRFTSPTAPPEQISLAAVDLGSFRPPAPPAITADEIERDALQSIRSDLMPRADDERRSAPLGSNVTVEAVVLEGEFPATSLVVYFRRQEGPDWLYARATRLWEDDGAFDSDYYLAVTTNLLEDLHSCGAPSRAGMAPDDTGVVWI